MSKPLELARRLIAGEQHWCTHHLAVDKDGIVVSPMSQRAVKRCAFGAVLAAAYQLTHHLDVAHTLARQLLVPIGYPTTNMSVNDNRGHSAVLALFDQLIADFT